jgi:hypothetical protein
MTIKRLETVEEYVRLMTVKDDVEKHFPCSHSEWVQWLVSHQRDTKLAIWANFEGGAITGYIVAYDEIVPPIIDSVSLLYVWSDLGAKANREVLELIKDWARSCGARSIRMGTRKEPRLFKKYGFKEYAIMMELTL